MTGEALTFRRRTVAAIALTAAVVAVSATPATAAATAPGRSGGSEITDPFYLPPPVPAGARPGDVVRFRKTSYTPLNPLSQQGTGYQVLYVTTDVHDRLMITSGLVVVPHRRASGSPLAAVAHGTAGMADRCAPSTLYDTGGSGDLLSDAGNRVWLDDAVNKGWVVAAPDYNGLGTPGNHTYSVALEQGRATLDAIRAAQRLRPAKVPARTRIVVTGYSEGGQSAAAAAELQPTYAPSMNLVGVAAGGVPADMPLMATFLDGGPGFGFLMLAALGFDTAYPERKMRSLLTDEGRKVVATVENACLSELLFGYSGEKLSTYTTRNPLDVPQIRAVFEENSLGRSTPRAPVLLFHGASDQYVPYAGGEGLRRDWCARGVQVTWRSYPTEHISTGFLAQPDVLDYLSSRIAGRTAPGNC